MINADRYIQPGQFTKQEFTPSPAQTVFTLAAMPGSDNAVFFYVNGLRYDPGTDYTVSGTTVTWLDTKFVISATDEVSILYVLRQV